MIEINFFNFFSFKQTVSSFIDVYHDSNEATETDSEINRDVDLGNFNLTIEELDAKRSTVTRPGYQVSDRLNNLLNRNKLPIPNTVGGNLPLPNNLLGHNKNPSLTPSVRGQLNPNNSIKPGDQKINLPISQKPDNGYPPASNTILPPENNYPNPSFNQYGNSPNQDFQYREDQQAYYQDGKSNYYLNIQYALFKAI
jgi:hypothetical protein